MEWQHRGKRPPLASTCQVPWRRRRRRRVRGCLVCTCMLMYALTCKPALHFYGARRTKRYKAISSFHARIGVQAWCVVRVTVARAVARVFHGNRGKYLRETNGISPVPSQPCFTANASGTFISRRYLFSTGHVTTATRVKRASYEAQRRATPNRHSIDLRRVSSNRFSNGKWVIGLQYIYIYIVIYNISMYIYIYVCTCIYPTSLNFYDRCD